MFDEIEEEHSLSSLDSFFFGLKSTSNQEVTTTNIQNEIPKTTTTTTTTHVFDEIPTSFFITPEDIPPIVIRVLQEAWNKFQWIGMEEAKSIYQALATNYLVSKDEWNGMKVKLQTFENQVIELKNEIQLLKQMSIPQQQQQQPPPPPLLKPHEIEQIKSSIIQQVWNQIVEQQQQQQQQQHQQQQQQKVMEEKKEKCKPVQTLIELLSDDELSTTEKENFTEDELTTTEEENFTEDEIEKEVEEKEEKNKKTIELKQPTLSTVKTSNQTNLQSETPKKKPRTWKVRTRAGIKKLKALNTI